MNLGRHNTQIRYGTIITPSGQMMRKKIIPVQVCKSTFLFHHKDVLPQLH